MAKPRREFPAFPFDPYPIQLDFMAALYDSLDKGGVAMLESPTGTGKTLSIICSALQWIVDQRQRPKIMDRKPNDARTGTGDCAEEEPDWMRDFVADAGESCPSKTKEKRAGIVADASVLARNRGHLKKSEKGSSDASVEFDEMEFLVEEYESEEEGAMRRKRGARSGCSSSEEEDEDSGAVGEEIEVTPKIYFSSRTHSQLTQFVRELKRTKFASELNAVCLGSRKNLCINEGVLRLGNSNRINERCLELQKNKHKNVKQSKSKVQSGGVRMSRAKTSCCPMLKKQSLQTKFRNEVLEQDILDIEDLVDLGRKIGTCPYYGSRRVVPAADLVALPYQSLLLRSARESLGLNLKNNIVIIDEAHNLADSLTNMYNAKITVSQLKHVQSHLDMYLDRFRACLGASNRRYIQTLVVLTKAFLTMLLRDESDATSVNPCNVKKYSEFENVGGSSLTINEFLFALDIDNINLIKLCQYIKESNIIHKVSGFGAKIATLQGLPGHIDGQNSIQEGTIIASFQALSDLLFSLTYNDDDGRIILSKRGNLHLGQSEEGFLKFVMLSGDKIFSEILDQTHAVVLAGGTLKPIEETRIRLFPGLLPDKVHFFSCNHIVPPESILPIAICRGPSGMTFDFTYNSRCSPNMMEELGRLLCNLVAVVPEGIVMFFSSFEYEGQVYQAWKASGILARILKKKLVFREPRSSLDVEDTLKEYKEAIIQCNSIGGDNRGPCGALLLAVVGGKISEGINFSDGMGRCVVMVGLPYPNPCDVELMERVKHIDRLGEPSSSRLNNPSGNRTYAHTTVQSGFEVLRSCRQRGGEYYENLCMKAVNQSIGRAIRHIKDYAAILLVDSRYASEPSKMSSPHPTEKLPVWIKDRLVFATESYGEVHRLLHQFFQFNKQRTQLET